MEPEAPRRTTLADRLEARAGDLARASIDAMYAADRFWEARFGERGRRFADEDGGWHVKYLVEALREDRPEILERYARWLQTVLTTRGMCSLHLAENFRTLADAIAAAVPDAGPAVEMLRRAEAALSDPAEAAALVADDVAGAARAAAAGRPAAAALHRLPYLLSYLADATALRRPDVFRNYAAWLAVAPSPAGVAPAALEDLRAVVAEVLRAAGREAAASLVEGR